MGRATWGTTNLTFGGSLYSSCYRTGALASLANLSQQNFIRSSVDPFLYFGNSGTTNSSFETYVYNKGFAYGIALQLGSPSGGTASVYRDGSAFVTSSSTNNARINQNNIYVSANVSYIQIRFSAGTGFTFNGWYTGSGGTGSLITSSTSYNAYHTYSAIKDRSVWYSKTTSSVSSETAILGRGTPSFRACFYQNSQLVYYDDSYTAMQAPNLYRNSGLTLTLSVNDYLSNGSAVRLYQSGGWNGPLSLCFF